MDWDYHMKLQKQVIDIDTIFHGGCQFKILNKKEYTNWRLDGIAFQVRDCEYTETNRTLATIQPIKDPKSGKHTLK